MFQIIASFCVIDVSTESDLKKNIAIKADIIMAFLFEIMKLLHSLDFNIYSDIAQSNFTCSGSTVL